MKDIQITGVTNSEGDPVEIEVTAIMQDEPTNGQGDGDKSHDSTISPLQVRSERSGPANGRVWHITFTATDPEGESCSATVTVCVPHDNSDETCIDEGPLYDSTQP